MVVTESVGTVQVQAAGAPWADIAHGRVLMAGESVRTGRASRCVLVFDDGSKVELGQAATFTIEEATQQSSFMNFSLGRMRAWVSKSLDRKFQVRTPTAVASVRGTEFGVDVQGDGRTSVACYEGLMAVADQAGREVLVEQGSRVDVDARGSGRVETIQGRREADQDRERAGLRREVGLDMTKEAVQAAAAAEMKSAVYREGKALLDVNGNRVRLEDYILKPRPDQFKLVVLNERADRFDFFYFLGTLNKTLPEDMSGALRQLRGAPFTAPEFFMTAFETGRSNTTDSVLENASGGHLVDVNNNGAANSGDNVSAAYDLGTDKVVRLNLPNASGGNDPFYDTLFDNYSLKFGQTGAMVEHTGWSGTNLQAYTAGQGITRRDAVSLVTTGCADLETCTFSDANRFFDRVYRQNGGGTVWDRFDNVIISDEGKAAKRSEFANLAGGADFKQLLLKWNYEQIVTASEFQGRKIDLVFEPKILIESGLIP